jgi:nitroreductase
LLLPRKKSDIFRRSGPASKNTQESNEYKETTLDFIENVIMTRASARKYTGESISEEDLLRIVKAGFAAPSAVNVQPWDIVLVTDRSKLDALCHKLPYAKMLDKAAAAIVVCGNPHKDLLVAKHHWKVDCAAMTENILLAAHSLGYGAVWTAVHPDEAREKSVRQTLGIPEKIIPLNVIPIGVIEGKAPEPKDKLNKKALHREEW